MKLKNIVEYLNLLIAENELLISEIDRGKFYWYVLNTLLRYPALLFVGITGILASISIQNYQEGIQVAILVMSSITICLNITHAFMKPDLQIESSKNMTQCLDGLNCELRLSANELSADCIHDNEYDLDQEALNHYLLAVVKFELNKSNIMKNMPSKLFMRSRKTMLLRNDPGISEEQLGKLQSRKQSAFDFSDSEDGSGLTEAEAKVVVDRMKQKARDRKNSMPVNVTYDIPI